MYANGTSLTPTPSLTHSFLLTDLYVLRRAVGVYQQIVNRFTAQTTDYQELLSVFAEGLFTEMDFRCVCVWCVHVCVCMCVCLCPVCVCTFACACCNTSTEHVNLVMAHVQ
jgi:hypothetical protein